jgi:hypothetical protein
MLVRTLLLLSAASLGALAEDLKHDDGKPDASRSVADVGFAVWFDGPLETTTVKLHAARGRARAFDIVAMDRAHNVLAQAAYDGALLPEKAGWVKLAFQLEAEEGALVVLSFGEGEEGAISVDHNKDDRHSTYYYGGNHQPFDDGNWMIRLSDGNGAKPTAFPKAELPADAVVRADAGDAVEVRRAAAGHAVRFRAPDGQVLKGLSVYAARTGRMTRRFEVALCDDALRPLSRQRVPYGVVGPDEAWYAFELAPAPLTQEFWVVLDFACLPADWIAVGTCRNKAGVASDARPGGVLRRFPPGESWMVRAHFAPGERPAVPAALPAAPEDATVAAEIAKKFAKARERQDTGRLLSVLAVDAPGFEWLRETKELEGTPARWFMKVVATDVSAERATVVLAALQGPLLYDPPEEWRAKRRGLAPGPILWRPDGPGRHSAPMLFALDLAKGEDGWKLRGWDEMDFRDASWGALILRDAKPEDVIAGLATARSESLADLDAAVREIEDPAAKTKALGDMARVWGEEGDLEKWAALAKELPEEDAAMLRQVLFVPGKRCLGAGPDEKPLRAAVDLADTLLEALEKRFGLAPDGHSPKLRLLHYPSDQSGFAAHPEAWAYPEVIWFTTDADAGKPPDPLQLALALADACVRFWDDAQQTRRWLAAGMLAEASLANRETPAVLRDALKDVPAGRSTIGGHLRIIVGVSDLVGDKGLGAAIAAARSEGACRDVGEGRQLVLDELAKMLGRETKQFDEIEALFQR